MHDQLGDDRKDFAGGSRAQMRPAKANHRVVDASDNEMIVVCGPWLLIDEIVVKMPPSAPFISYGDVMVIEQLATPRDVCS